MSVKFLDRYLLVDPSFGFDQERLVGRTRDLRRFYVTGDSKVFRCEFRLPVYDIREAAALPLGREIDAHFNAHYDGTPFEQEWPQHLDTFANDSVILTGMARAGDSRISAAVSDAVNRVIDDPPRNVFTALASMRVETVDAEGEWGFFGAGTTETPLVWDDDVRNADAFVCFPTAAQYPAAAMIRRGDQLRLTQGDLNAVWNVRATSRRNADRRVVIALDGPATTFAGTGAVVDNGATSARVTRTTRTVQAGVNNPLLPGRYVAFAGHAKLYCVTATAASSFTVTPELYEDVAANTVLDTTPVVMVRYTPEMEPSQSYAGGALTSRVVSIEEAL